MDAPTGDDQLLSAARACFDRGDFACATQYYQKISGSMADIKASEQIFMVLDKNGAGMGTFAAAFGNIASSGVGAAITAMAGSMASGANLTRRMAIYNDAFLQITSVSNPKLQGFVRFLASLALMEEILAEAAETDGKVHVRDVVRTPASCNTTSCATPSDTNCLVPVTAPGSNLQDAPNNDIANPANAPNTAQPNLDQFYWAMKYANDGLNQLGGAGGAFNGLANNPLFSQSQPSTLGLPTVGLTYACFRQTLIAQGVGVSP